MSAILPLRLDVTPSVFGGLNAFAVIEANASFLRILYPSGNESNFVMAGEKFGAPALIILGVSGDSKVYWAVIGGAEPGSMLNVNAISRLLAFVVLTGVSIMSPAWLLGQGIRVAEAQVVNGTFTGVAGTGWTSTVPTGSSLTFTGTDLVTVSDNDGGTNSRTYASQAITTTEPGVLSWLLRSYTSVDTDLGVFDYPTVLIGSTFYWVNAGGGIQTTPTGAIDNDDTGLTNLSVSAGFATGTAVTIGAGVTSTDSGFGAGTATWDDVEFQELAQSPGAQSVDEDVVLTFSGANTLSVATNATGTMTVTLTVTNGVINLGTTVGITITGGGDGTSTVTFTGTQAQVNTALASTTYTPTADYNGAATLTFSSTFDGQTDTDTVNITVNPVPDFALTIAKVADRATVTAVGQTINYTITVENTGDTDLTGTSISDDLNQNGTITALTVTGPTGDGGTIGTMEPGEIWVYSASHVVTAGQLADENDLVNTATFDTAETLPVVSNDVTVSIPLPVLTLQKVVVNSTAVPGDWTLTFSGGATGTGISGAPAVTSVTVPVGTYALSETNVSAPANYTLSNLVCTGAADTTAGPLNLSIDLTYGETVTCVFSNRRFRTITLLKDTVGGFASDTDWTLTATSTAVTRTGSEGDASITGIGAGSAPLTLTETGPAGYVLTGLSCVGTADTATSVANPIISVVSGEHAFCTYTNTFDGSYTIEKEVDVSAATSTGTLNYTITVTNTGTADLTSPALTDSIEQNGTTLALASGPTLTSGDTDLDNELDVGEVWVYSATYTVTQANLDDGNDIVNTASFTTAELTTPQTNAAITTITADPSLSVTKTATYGGGPTTANGTTDNLAVGEVITYTYVITNDGNQTITNISLGDVHNGSGTAPAPNADNATLTDNSPLLDSDNSTTGDSAYDQLAPGDVLTVTSTYTVTQSDLDTLQ